MVVDVAAVSVLSKQPEMLFLALSLGHPPHNTTSVITVFGSFWVSITCSSALHLLNALNPCVEGCLMPMEVDTLMEALWGPGKA